MATGIEPASGLPCDLTVLILTLNEERHIARCLSSIKGLAGRVVVIDSHSTDRTCEIADRFGAEVLKNPFVSHSYQLNWALDNASIATGWVMKLDADEVVTADLVVNLKKALSAASKDIAGFTLNLRRCFLGKWLRHGGLYPVRLLRVWRTGKGRSESRWMDEHIKADGRVVHLDADFVDDNLNNITWWTNKHNNYATREAIEMLMIKTRGTAESDTSGTIGRNAKVKRWIKKRLYSRLPLGLRALLYFLYRYFLRLGFLDGWQGFVFHFLQGFWYRFLVDVKVYELETLMQKEGLSLKQAVRREFGYEI